MRMLQSKARENYIEALLHSQQRKFIAVLTLRSISIHLGVGFLLLNSLLHEGQGKSKKDNYYATLFSLSSALRLEALLDYRKTQLSRYNFENLSLYIRI